MFQKDSWKGACRSQAAAETCEAAAGSPAGGGEGRPRGLGSWEKWVPLGGSPEGSRGWPHLHPWSSGFSPVKWDCYKGQYSGQLGLEPGDLSLQASCLEERLMGYLLILGRGLWGLFES